MHPSISASLPSSRDISELRLKKGKDVDLYSAFHAPGTANAHVAETDPPYRYLGHRQACKHSLGSDPITGTGSASQQVCTFVIHH